MHLIPASRAVECSLCPSMVDVVGLVCQALFGASFGGFGSCGVNVFRQFRRFHQDGDHIVVHIGKALVDEHVLFLSGLCPVAQYADFQGRQERDVILQDRKLASHAGAHGHGNGGADNCPVRRHNFKSKFAH